MKILLACLLCLILPAAECFAIAGGPIYPASTNLTGNYSGVLQGVFDPTNPASSNSIGIFSLGVPTTGNATGTFIMFSRGRVFTGTVQASADPNKASLKGVLDASYNYTISQVVTNTDGTSTIQTIPVTATANGPISATVSTPRSSSLFGTSSSAILRGDGTLNISQGQVTASGDPIISSIISLVVSGVKQASS